MGWLRRLWKCTSYRRSHPSPDHRELEIKENCLRSDISCDVQLSSGIVAMFDSASFQNSRIRGQLLRQSEREQ